VTQPAEQETITQSEFQKRLGVSPAYLASRQDIKEWLQAQPGVVRVNPRRLSIPASLVAQAQAQFQIQPRARRTRRTDRREKPIDYQSLSVAELLAFKAQDEALLDGTDYEKAVRDARQALSEIEAKAESAKNANSRLARLNKVLGQKKAELDAEAERLDRERKLLAAATH
jgi:hypothetical protein